MNEQAFWSTEQPNFGPSQIRDARQLLEGMSVRLHRRVGNKNMVTIGKICRLDRKKGLFKVDPALPWYRFSDYGLEAVMVGDTPVWHRFNWLEKSDSC